MGREPIGKDDEVLICSPSAMANAFIVPGTILTECSCCEDQLTISPGGQALREEKPDIRVLCPICVQALDVDGRLGEVPPAVTPVIRAEVERQTGMSPETIFNGLTSKEALEMLARKYKKEDE